MRMPEGPVPEFDLHVSVDDEGVVRVLNVGEDEAILVGKVELERLLTAVYGRAMSVESRP